MADKHKPEEIKDDKPLMGRPIKYDEKFEDQAYNLALLGLTDLEMAPVFGIVESTFHKWKIDFPKFRDAIKRGKTISDGEVAASFRKRAVGYRFDEIQIEKRYGEVVSEKITTKDVPSDARAAFQWLTNRHPDKWKSVHSVEINDYSEQTKSDLLDEIKRKLGADTETD